MDDKNGYSILEVFWISFIALYLVVCIVSSLLFVFTPVGNLIISNIASSNDSQFPFYSISLHVFFAGFLGGALFAARNLYKKLPIDGSQDGDDLDDRFEIKLVNHSGAVKCRFYWAIEY